MPGRGFKRRGSFANSSKAKRTRLNPQIRSQLAYAVRREIAKNEEVKIHDTELSLAIDTVGSVWELDNVTQGTTALTRIGNLTHPKSLDIKLAFNKSDATNMMRFLIIQWHQDTAVFTPGITTCLDPVAVAAGLGVQAPYNNENHTLFRVVMDRVFLLDAGGDLGKVWKKITPSLRKTEYNGSAVTGTEKLYAMVISDSNVAAHPAVQGYIRLGFQE